MADVKISGLPTAVAVEADDLLELSEETGGGSYASRKATAAQLKGYVLGTANVSFSGPTAPRSYTLPDASATLLSTNATVTVAEGGTGATDAATARSNLAAAAAGAVAASGLTMNAARLLGRSSAAVGAVEEMTVGTGLSLSSGALSCTITTPIPAGTIMLFVQSAAPTGWTKSTTHNNKALRVVSGTAGSGGSVAFTTAFASQAVSGAVGNTTLSSAQMPWHEHYVFGQVLFGSGAAGSAFPMVSSGDGFRSTGTASAGLGEAHGHSFSGTAINLAVQYVDVIIATKD